MGGAPPVRTRNEHFTREGLSFSRLNILAFGLVLIVLPALVLGYASWHIIPMLLVIYFIILGWGVFDIGSQFFIKTYWKGSPGQVALTFDDGPHPEITPQVLDVLRDEQVKAAFFVIGKNAEKHPELVQRMVQEGHVVANHTYNHAYVFSKRAAMKQVSEGQAVIEHIIGKKTQYFRPPFGVLTPEIARAVQKQNCVIVGWDLRSRDGTIRSKEAILKRVVPRLKKATVLLFHDTNPVTPNVVQEIIHLCKNNGTKIVPLPTQINVEPYLN